MQHSFLLFQTAAWFAVLGFSAPAMGQGDLPSASSTDDNPVFAPEGTTTTTSEGNADGSRTVTTTDADGNVLDQHTEPGEPGPEYSTLEEIQAEIERRADEANEWNEGWDEDFPDSSDTDTSDSGGSESAVPPPSDGWEPADDQLDYVDMDAMGAEMTSLEDRLDELPEEIDEAATDEEAEALEAEAAAAAQRLRELQAEYDQILDDTQEEAIRRAAERHRRQTGHRGALHTPTPTHTPPAVSSPRVPAGRPHRPGY